MSENGEFMKFMNGLQSFFTSQGKFNNNKKIRHEAKRGMPDLLHEAKSGMQESNKVIVQYLNKRHEAKSEMPDQQHEAECELQRSNAKYEAECGMLEHVFKNISIGGRGTARRGQYRGGARRGHGRGGGGRGRYTGNFPGKQDRLPTPWGGVDPETQQLSMQQRADKPAKDKWIYTVDGGQKKDTNAEDAEMADEMDRNPGMRPAKARRILIPDYKINFGHDQQRFAKWTNQELAFEHLMQGPVWPMQYQKKTWKYQILTDVTSYQLQKMARHLSIDLPDIWPVHENIREVRANDRLFAVGLATSEAIFKILQFCPEILHGSDAFKKVKYAPIVTASWILNDGAWYYNPPGPVKLNGFLMETLRQNDWLLEHKDQWVYQRDETNRMTLQEMLCFKQAGLKWASATETQISTHFKNCILYKEDMKKVDSRMVNASGKATFLHQRLKILNDEENGTLSEKIYKEMIANKLQRKAEIPECMKKNSGLTQEDRREKELYLKQQKDLAMAEKRARQLELGENDGGEKSGNFNHLMENMKTFQDTVATLNKTVEGFASAAGANAASISMNKEQIVEMESDVKTLKHKQSTFSKDLRNIKNDVSASAGALSKAKANADTLEQVKIDIKSTKQNGANSYTIAKAAQGTADANAVALSKIVDVISNVEVVLNMQQTNANPLVLKTTLTELQADIKMLNPRKRRRKSTLGGNDDVEHPPTKVKSGNKQQKKPTKEKSGPTGSATRSRVARVNTQPTSKVPKFDAPTKPSTQPIPPTKQVQSPPPSESAGAVAFEPESRHLKRVG